MGRRKGLGVVDEDADEDEGEGFDEEEGEEGDDECWVEHCLQWEGLEV